MEHRKRSRTHSNASSIQPLHPNQRLLRLNVGGTPYDIIRTSLPLLETMMTDRWLDTCLYDSDGRIYLDRDGGIFGELMTCLRSPEILVQMARSKGGMERLGRLRSEADYYAHEGLVRMIDDVCVGQRVVFESTGWARVAGGCLIRNGVGGGGNNINDVVGDGQEGRPNAANANQNDANAAEVADDNEENANAIDYDEENNDDGDDDEAEDEEQFEFEEDQDDPTQPPPYKRWSWSRQYGNPDVLRPHPTHSQMIVGEDGTYLMLLRFAAALPSPLARIKWDQEEEEDRRVTRGAARRRRRGQSGNNVVDENDEDRERLVEEDYFVTVNIEAPLQTVMDYIDESQTHFPLLRAGLWDYRTEEEVLHEDPVFATVCAMDIVSLRAGDKLTVSYMADEISRESCPLPDDAPPELVNSLTLIKLCGNTVARYERLKSSPDVIFQSGLTEPIKSDRVTTFPLSPARNKRKSDYNDDERDDETYDTPSGEHDHEMEEFDRCLTREAHWIEPRNDFQTTPFKPTFSHASSILEFPQPGLYLLTGRVAVGCRRDATFSQVLEGGPVEGHRTHLSLRSVGGRLLHSLGAFAFEDKPRLGCADLSILSENGMFNDIVYVPKSGTELSISTTGDCRLHPEGTEVGPFCSAKSQSLSVILLDEVMEADRYMVRTIKTEHSAREIKWFHTRNTSASRSSWKGGTPKQPSLFDVDGHRLVWRGRLPTEVQSPSQTTAVLVIGAIPPLRRGYILGLMKNNEPVALSITPESLDMKGRHCHYFQEVMELRDADEITIAVCGYVGDDGQRGWRDHLHIEPRRIELDTSMGYLAFLVLDAAEENINGSVN